MVRRDGNVKQKRHNEYTLGSLLEHSDDGVVVLSLDGKPLYISPSVKKILGYTEEEVMKMDMFSLTHPDDILPLATVMQEVMASPGIPLKGHTGRMRHKNGTWRWIEATVTNLLHDPSVNGIVDNFRDITDKRAAEEKLLHAKRLYSVISQINQTIVHSTNQQELFKKACTIAVEYGEFKVAWIGIFDLPGRRINLVDAAGMPLEDLSAFNNVSFGDNGPLDQVLKTGEHYVCNNIQNDLEVNEWKPFELNRRYGSCIVLPIRKAGNIIGTYNIYSTEIDFFNEQEIELLTEAAGDISFALGIFEKEKHREQMVGRIIHSELQLNQAQEIAHFGSWDLSFATGIATWSDEACRIYGLDVKDNLHSYEAWLSYIHPADKDYVLAEIQQGQNAFSRSAFHHRIVLKDLSIKYIYSQSEFTLNNEGKPIGMHGVAHDRTEMKEAEEGLAHSESKLRAVIENTDASIYSLDTALCYITFNKSLKNSLKEAYGLEVKIGDNVYGFLEKIEPAEAEEWKEIYAKALSGETVKFEKVFAFEDFYSCISFSIYPMWENERIIGLSCFAIDTTTQKQDNIQKEKMLADIIHRNQSLEQFSYIVSHNLRAPVANILGLTDLLMTGEYNEEERILFEGLSGSVKKLDMVINDLNQILEVNNLVQEKELVHFAQLLSDIKSSISNLLSIKEVEISADFSAAGEMFTLKSYMHSIFINLVSNSVKYSQPGTIPIINITTHKGENSIELVFKDNGLGIDLEKNANNIFGLYKRFHNHTEGKGMGLYMVKKQVEALGGTITIDSEVYKGTTFTIRFNTN